MIIEQVVDSTILSDKSEFLQSVTKEVAKDAMREELQANTDVLFDSFFEQVLHRILLT